MPREGIYDAALVCRNGHPINSQVNATPKHNVDYCTLCGAPTISKCLNCSEAIRGYYAVPGVNYPWSHPADHFDRPKFCHHCGQSYPWTQAAIKAAKELADEQGSLSLEEKVLLKLSLDDLVKETPALPVSSSKFKRLVGKAGREAADGFKAILIDVISESAKKIIWPTN